MNESETQAEYIDPKLRASGWGEVGGLKVLREFRITERRIQTGGKRSKSEMVEELDEEKLPVLLNLKYHAIDNAVSTLGDVDVIHSIFFGFQRNLYTKFEDSP